MVMALHLIFRPLHPHWEPLPRPDAASIRKLLAEGGLEETITFLGWLINTRLLTIALTPDKEAAWRAEVENMIASRKAVKLRDIQRLLGRLNHVCFVIPNAKHFMNNLRKTEYLAKFRKQVKLPHTAVEYLELWLILLELAHRGISINRVVFRKPTIASFSGASETGIGGFCPKTGVAWRHEFSNVEQAAFTLNAKEYLGSAIDSDFQLEMDPDPHPFPCVLNWTDSTSAMGWLQKSNHDPVDVPAHNVVARFHARSMLRRNTTNYFQHPSGSTNVIADSLSCDFHLSGDQLVLMLTSLVPSLRIKVVPLPQRFTSKIASLAQKWPGTKESPSKSIRSTIAAGVAGWSSSSESTMYALSH